MPPKIIRPMSPKADPLKRGPKMLPPFEFSFAPVDVKLGRNVTTGRAQSAVAGVKRLKGTGLGDCRGNVLFLSCLQGFPFVLRVARVDAH